MVELVLLPAEEVAVRLGRISGSGRGFLELDPVVQNEPLLALLLAARSALVFSYGDDALVGAQANPDNPRQAFVSATSDCPAAVAALLDFLRAHRRCTSAVALVAPGAGAVAAFEALGFTGTGRLRDHYYRSGSYLDALIYYRRLEPTCT